MPRQQPTQIVPIPAFDEAHTLGLYSSLVEHSGWKTHRIEESATKTPDMWLRKDGVAIINELKSPELHFNVERGLFLFQSEYSKLAKQLHKSVKQLRSFDAAHEHPWLVTYISYHFQLGVDAFVSAIQGGFTPGDGNIYPPRYLGSRPHQQILADIHKVDAVLWLQAHESGEHVFAGTLCGRPESPFRSQVDLLAGDLRGLVGQPGFCFAYLAFAEEGTS